MNMQEAIAYAKELMRSRRYCEIAQSRVLLLLNQSLQGKENLSKIEVEQIVIAKR